MKKIPTLFQRSEDRRSVIDAVTPGCEWVLAGEGTATRKYDGTCVLIRRDGMAVKGYARREVKPGKEPPPGWIEADHDETTGKRVGWEPIGQSGFARWFDEAIALHANPLPGTYELLGPKINGNPEGWKAHVLIRHADAARLGTIPLTFDGLRDMLTNGDDWPVSWEGIVWHHPDGRMAKIKRRDFPAAGTSQ